LSSDGPLLELALASEKNNAAKINSNTAFITFLVSTANEFILTFTSKYIAFIHVLHIDFNIITNAHYHASVMTTAGTTRMVKLKNIT